MKEEPQEFPTDVENEDAELIRGAKDVFDAAVKTATSINNRITAESKKVEKAEAILVGRPGRGPAVVEVIKAGREAEKEKNDKFYKEYVVNSCIFVESTPLNISKVDKYKDWAQKCTEASEQTDKDYKHFVVTKLGDFVKYAK